MHSEKNGVAFSQKALQTAVGLRFDTSFLLLQYVRAAFTAKNVGKDSFSADFFAFVLEVR